MGAGGSWGRGRGSSIPGDPAFCCDREWRIRVFVQDVDTHHEDPSGHWARLCGRVEEVGYAGGHGHPVATLDLEVETESETLKQPPLLFCYG